MLDLYDRMTVRLSVAGDWLLPTLARFGFAAVLLTYFWTSAMTKLGPGLLGVFQPSLGAYAQIFPRQMEARLRNSSCPR